MFLTSKYSGYNRKGEQSAAGLFLLVAGGPDWVLNEETGRLVSVKFPLRAAVRYVRLTQLGHWMMGTVQLGSKRISVSGAYGSDGLPLDVDKVPYHAMLPLPKELEQEFWKGGGHNTSGKEAPSLRKWAKENMDALRKAGRKQR